MFHSGDIKFGDAHLVVDGKISYKTPLSFHNLKTGKGSFNRLHLNDKEEANLRDDSKQLKQIRSGFINEELSYSSAEYSYSQKSSYDKEKRHSKDGGMFGYSALKSGTTWRFKVSYSDEIHISQVEENLVGSKRLGKSKTAQYGNVTISTIDSPQKLSSYKPTDDTTYLYVNSRIVLTNDDGEFVFEPTLQNLGLKSGVIDWKNSFIQTSTFTPYNYKRQTDEYTRLCINKGSVIAIKDLKENLDDSFHVGAFFSEGFGEVLVNPSFLKEKEPKLSKWIKKTVPLQDLQKDENLIAYLKAKKEDENSKFEVATHVQEVYEKLIGPNKSQWGEIRSLASVAQNRDELLEKIKDYIESGSAKKQWEGTKSKLYVEIEKSSSPLELTKLLSMITSKHSKGANNE